VDMLADGRRQRSTYGNKRLPAIFSDPVTPKSLPTIDCPCGAASRSRFRRRAPRQVPGAV
jgi:hypothetical protein